MSVDLFHQALSFVLEWECVFDRAGNVIAENDPDDPGGVTKYGIDQRSHPSVAIRTLSLDGAAAIYEREYWQKALCPEMPGPLAFVHFDTGINTGLGTAAMELQEAVGAKVDGHIGPKTLAAVKAANPQSAAVRFLELRDARYRSLARRGSYRKFLKGWLNRTAALRREIKEVTA